MARKETDRLTEQSNDESPTTSRRAFLGTAGGAAGALFAGSFGAFPVVAAVAGDKGLATTREILYLDNAQMGPLAGRDGGLPFAATRTSTEPTKASGLAIQFEPLTLQFGAGMAPGLYQWVSDSLALKASPRSGFVAFTGSDGRETGRLSFTNALISEVDLPTFDAIKNDSTRMSVTLAPEFSQLHLAPSTPVPHTLGPRGKEWRASGFTVAIDKIDGKKVMTVDSRTTRFKIAAYGEGIARAVGGIERGNLLVTVHESEARPYLDWFNQLWGPGGNPTNPALLRTVVLNLISDDRTAVLGTVTFRQVGVAKVSPQRAEAADSIRKVDIELYVGSMELTGFV